MEVQPLPPSITPHMPLVSQTLLAHCAGLEQLTVVFDPQVVMALLQIPLWHTAVASEQVPV